jgi:integrase
MNKWRSCTRKPARVAAGLAEDVGLHSCATTYASRLIRFGESVKTVQRRLGHASAQETLNIYGHLWPDADERTREAVAGIIPGRDAPYQCQTEAVGMP